MFRMRWLTVLAVLLAANLLTASPAQAGPLLDWLGCGDCPRPDYSPFRYWTPALARTYDCVHGPRIDVHPPDRHPEIPPTFLEIKYPCPATPPATTIIWPPSAPPESKAR